MCGNELEVDGTLTINSGRVLDLNGQTLDLNGTLSNSGTLKLRGTEAVQIVTMDTNSGTVEYRGDGDITAET